MINASTKSGSNSFHGSVFEYLRNDHFDARNFFLANTIPLKRNQYGFAVGGPVWKDKIFLFCGPSKYGPAARDVLQLRHPEPGSAARKFRRATAQSSYRSA